MAETQCNVRLPDGATPCLVDGCKLMALLECRNCGTRTCHEHRASDHAKWCGSVHRMPRPLPRKIPVATGPHWDERVVTGEKPRRRNRG